MTNLKLSIAALLKTYGPMRSSMLAAKLEDALGVTTQTARKRISRVEHPVCKLSPSLLPKREAFLYLEEDFESDRFFSALLRDLRQSGSIHGMAFDGLVAKGGNCRVVHFPVIAGAPIAQKGQVSASMALENLVDANLVSRVDFSGEGNCVVSNHLIAAHQDQASLRARELAENVLLNGVHERVRNLGLASYQAIEVRTETSVPRFSVFSWDVVGPSYLSPLTTKGAKNIKPGFFVADVLFGGIGTLDVHHIQFFLRKVKAAKAAASTVPFLPMLLAEGFTKEALRAGRAAGIIMATPKNLFDASIAEGLRTLIETLTHAAAVAKNNPEKIGKLLDQLGAIDGATGNLRGALFEMIVGYLVADNEGGSIDIGEQIKDPTSGKLAEIDVRRIQGKTKCWSYECRARNPKNLMTLDEIEIWLERVDRISSYYRSEKRFQNYELGFELWTTGNFDTAALKKLEMEQEKRKKRIKLSWKNGDMVRNYAKGAQRKSMLDTLDEHYFKNTI